VVKPVDFDAFLEAMSNLGFYWLLVNQVTQQVLQTPEKQER
jgi:hypothetical protein